jgi:hypothetical protein
LFENEGFSFENAADRAVETEEVMVSARVSAVIGSLELDEEGD